MIFKNSQGRWLTNALFFELTLANNREHVLYTLKDSDHVVGKKIYKSLKNAFLSCEDPTEYDFANQYLGGWSHWKELQDVKGIAPLVEEWREEKSVMLKSIGQKRMIAMAKQADASFQAAKWLADEGWKEKQTKGRPSKAQVNQAAKEAAAKKGRHTGDLARLRSV